MSRAVEIVFAEIVTASPPPGGDNLTGGEGLTEKILSGMIVPVASAVALHMMMRRYT
jgi:hypothetical protein